jgi:hypothetical protein
MTGCETVSDGETIEVVPNIQINAQPFGGAICVVVILI